MTSIEFSYSSLLKKHTIRTKGIVLTGRGIVQHHSQCDGKPYNVYAVTQLAFERISAEHPSMTVARD